MVVHRAGLVDDGAIELKTPAQQLGDGTCSLSPRPDWHRTEEERTIASCATTTEVVGGVASNSHANFHVKMRASWLESMTSGFMRLSYNHCTHKTLIRLRCSHEPALMVLK